MRGTQTAAEDKKPISALLAALSIMLLIGAGLVLTGCDGDGIFNFKSADGIYGDDQPDDDDDDDNPPTPIPDDATSLGTWITAFGDSWIDPTARYGVLQYAAKVTLTREGTILSGKGTVFRVFREGPVPYDTLTIRMSGTFSNDEATLNITSATGGSVYDYPVWVLRFAGRRMVGMYVAYNSSQQVVRSGYAVWQKVSTGVLSGTWVSGYTDAYGSRTWPARDRTGTMVLTHDTTNQSVTGTGHFIEQRDGDAMLESNFNVTQAQVTAPQILFSMGELSLEGTPIDWFGFYTSGIMTGAYAQFDPDDVLVRYGTAVWYASPDPTTTAVNATWLTSFTDSTTASESEAGDYLMSVRLKAEADNVVSGSGEFLATDLINESFKTVRVEEGTILGSRVRIETSIPGTAEYFSWDLRLAGSVMVGSYQHFDGFGRFISRGSAEWRKLTSSTPNSVGAWASGFFDTLNVTNDEVAQFATVSVTSQGTDGTLQGQGTLRLGNGERNRRLFALANSSESNNDILWVWRGADLFGDTVWRLRHAGDVMFGIYVNQNSIGNLESRGSAMWVRTALIASK